MDNYLNSFREMLSLRGLSDRTVNACISQLRFFHIYVLHKSWDPFQLPFRKFDSYVPFIPSRQEMQTFLFSITDIKYKTILCLMFSAGLRVGEVRHLKCSDIEHSRNRIHIRASKNRSDRYAQLSDKVWELILQYWYSFPSDSRPKDWLFPQKRKPDKPIDHQRIPEFILAHEKASMAILNCKSGNLGCNISQCSECGCQSMSQLGRTHAPYR